MGGGSTAVKRIQGLLPVDSKASGVPGKCLQGGATSRSNLWVHFVHLYIRDKIFILEEGNRTHPRCHECDMFVP